MIDNSLSNLLFREFKKIVQEYPNNIAIVDGKKSISYLELFEKINCYANYLAKENVKPQDRVVIILERGAELLVYMMATIFLGAIYVPIDLDTPKKRIDQLIDRLKPKKIINNINKKSLVILNQEKKFLDEYLGHHTIHPNEICYIIHTSGSTGIPKGVMITHKGINNYNLWLKTFLRCLPGELIDFSSSQAFDMAITCTLSALILGLTIVVASNSIKKNPRKYLEFLANKKINYIKITPSYLQVLLYELNFCKILLPTIKKIIIGGEPLLTQDAKKWLDYFPKHELHNEYGPTEVTVAVTQCCVNKDNINDITELQVPIGYVGNNMLVKIIDDNLNEATQGELLVGGDGLAEGYWQQSDLTKEKFIFINNERYYRTGDLCRKLDDGHLLYISRLDSQVKIRGYRVDLLEIESILRSHMSTMKFAVTCYKNQIIVCYQSHVNDALESCKLILKEYLPQYMQPHKWLAIESIPITTNGKLDHNKLHILIEEKKINLPNNESAAACKVSEIWSNELDVPYISLDSNFFSLGGDSLKAARVLIKIRNIYNKDILVHELYENPNFRDFLALIESKPMIYKARKKYKYQSLPLSDFQLMLWMSHRFEKKANNLNIVTRFGLGTKLNILDLKNKIISFIKEQKVFYYKINKFVPRQVMSNEPRYEIIGFDNLINILDQEADDLFNKLMNFNDWHDKNIMLCLYKKTSGNYEIQVAMPHIITDSKLIVLIRNLFLPEGQFNEYLEFEQATNARNLINKKNFWQDYLKDTDLITIPWEHITKNSTYSTYKPLTHEIIDKLINYNKNNSIFLSDILMSAVLKSLGNLIVYEHKSDKDKANIFVNQVRSTRFDSKFDSTIGCFLRIDPIKFCLGANLNDHAVIHAVKEQNKITDLFQEFPALIKMAYLPRYKNQNKFLNFLLKYYIKITKLNKLEAESIKAAVRLKPIKNTNAFVVNVNINHDFLSLDSDHSKTNIVNKYYDWISVDNCIDVSFIKFNSQPHIVVSANITQQLKNEIVSNIQDFIIRVC